MVLQSIFFLQCIQRKIDETNANSSAFGLKTKQKTCFSPVLWLKQIKVASVGIHIWCPSVSQHAAQHRPVSDTAVPVFLLCGFALESTSIMCAVAGQLGFCSIINATIVILTLCRPSGWSLSSNVQMKIVPNLHSVNNLANIFRPHRPPRTRQHRKVFWGSPSHRAHNLPCNLRLKIDI